LIVVFVLQTGFCLAAVFGLFARGVGLSLFLFACGAFLGCLPTVLAFPCFVIGLFALPLCGAAPTFLCRRKEK
jgi:hypothetical protein